MLWHELSWPALDKVDREIPVVIPLGSCEQHGRHLPVFVDSIQVTAIAEQVEKKMSRKILLTPTLWLGSSHHHRDFPSIISLPPSLYTQMIQQVATCILDIGFRRIFFLNGHGGNETPGSQALTELVNLNDQANDAYLVFASWWKLGSDALAPAKHGMKTENLSHACEYETSFTLFLRPDLVKLAEARDTPPVIDNKWFSSERLSGKVAVFRRFSRFTAAGNYGKPSAATAEKGRAMFEGIVGEVGAFLKDFAAWPALPQLGPK